MNASKDKILVIGGAGFIGSHLCNELARQGHTVRVLDALDPQVHGEDGSFPRHLSREVECIRGDVRNRDDVLRALRGATCVYHLAAAVGVGQSMYEIAQYTDVNNLGTAVLLECLMKHPIERLVVASSMSIYGEGLYRDGGKLFEPPTRDAAQLSRGRWEIENDGRVLVPAPTPETKTAMPISVYALSKYDQERLCLIFGSTYDVPTVALRFFNVYGTHQSLSNPYTGVLAIFASRCLNGNPPLIFEDGLQQRDFVSVHDIVQACTLARTTDAVGEVFNVGSGDPRSIASVASDMVALTGAAVTPETTGKYRKGDIRHCYADISKAQRLLGYRPKVRFSEGLTELAEWLCEARAEDNFMRASAELSARGLTL